MAEIVLGESKGVSISNTKNQLFVITAFVFQWVTQEYPLILIASMMWQRSF